MRVTPLRTLQLCSGILIRGDTVLLVHCRYEGEPEPLWTLPGGRQNEAETIAEAVVREFAEETSLAVSVDELAYVSESIDEQRALHVRNCTFFMREGELATAPHARDAAIVEARFVPVKQAPALLAADVLRIPVAAALGGEPGNRYYAFRDSDIQVPFFGRSGAAPHG